jgi:hypothetical protein
LLAGVSLAGLAPSVASAAGNPTRSESASPGPFPSAQSVGGGKKHQLKPLLNGSAKPPAGSAAPRGSARVTAAEQLPQGNPRTNGTWTELGPAPVNGLKYCCTGPPPQPISSFAGVSGRITSIALGPGVGAAPVYLGTAGGGVWRGDSQTASWTPLTDGQASLAIGAIAVDGSGRTIYAGTGEDNQSDSQPGQGILKSTDGGATWTLIGQSVFAGQHIGSIAIDRKTSDPQTVYVASDVGLYVSTDSGSTWTKVSIPAVTPIAGVSATSGAATLVIQDPSDAQIFWISVSDFCQSEAGDLFLYNNTLGTWAKVTPPAFAGASPQLVASRIGLGVGKGGVAYMSAADCKGRLVDLERGSSGGASWSGPLRNPGAFDYFNYSGTTQGQGDYDNVIAVDPANPDIAVFGGVGTLATVNGGATFVDIGQAYNNGGVLHPDVHALTFAPSDGDRLLIGTDGGLWSSVDLGGATHLPPFGTSSDWQGQNGNLGTIQFYKGSALDATHFLAGAQDNGTSGRLAGQSNAAPAWQAYFGGDGGNAAIDPGSSTIYVTNPGGFLFRGNSTIVAGDPASPDDSFVDAGPCRGISNPPDPACTDPTAFTAPFVMDPANAQRLFAGSNRVWSSSTGGVPPGPASVGGSWTAISNDLTFGTTLTPYTDRLQEMTAGPSNANVVMTASLLGKVFISTNATTATPTWTDMTGNLPAFNIADVVLPNGWIGGVTFNPANTSEAWAVMGGVNVGHVWHTVNGGTLWTDISGSGASGVPNAGVNGIALDPVDPNTVYIATDSTVMVCTACAGATPSPNWALVGTGLPNAKISSISFSRDNSTLMAWTHGRGAWSMPRLTAMVAPASLQFATATTGVDPPSQSLTVSAPTAATFTIANPAPPAWLHLTPSPSTPSAPGAPGQFTVSVTTAGMVGATYGGSITLSPSNGAPAISVNVTLEIARFPGAYHPVVPYRVLDTRSNIGHSGQLGPGQKISVQIAGTGGVAGVPGMGSSSPPSAVVLNVTATNPTQASYLTIYPGRYSACPLGLNCFSPGPPTPPQASNLNFVAGQTVPNLVEVAIGDDGTVSLYNAAGSVHVIVDVEGWVTRQDGTSPTAGLFNPLVPARIMDTRSGTGGHAGVMHTGESFTLQVSGGSKEGGGLSGVPASGASAVVLNVTVANGTAPSYLTLFPSDAPAMPTASNLNFVAGQTVPNRVMVKLSSSGQVTIYNAQGNVDVIIDVAGWYSDGATQTTGGRFTGLTPVRILDTRNGTGAAAVPVCAGQTITLQVSGRGGVPGLPTAKGVVMNVTVTNTTAGSFLTVYPGDATQPTASDLNWVPGLTVPNLVVVKISATDGTVKIYNAQGCVDVLADVVGWYS